MSVGCVLYAKISISHHEYAYSLHYLKRKWNITLLVAALDESNIMLLYGFIHSWVECNEENWNENKEVKIIKGNHWISQSSIRREKHKIVLTCRQC